MLPEEELSKLRFGMSEVPQPGGQKGDYEEKVTQWFLERSFFRDFTYRNPRGKKKGEELADAVVLFDDVAFLVEVKAQYGNHDAIAWATEASLKALKQVRATHDSLKTGAIKKLQNEVYGQVEFDPAKYPNMYGLIILAQQTEESFDADELIPEIKDAGFPVFVFSLKDIELITQRFDTAGDFVNFIECRTDMRRLTQFRVNDEENNLLEMAELVPAIYATRIQPITQEVLTRTVESFRLAATGELLESREWRYGLAIDDMIARAHDLDPGLPWNHEPPSDSAEVARFLGWLTRYRRIRLGKRMLDKCLLSESTGEPQYFTHYQKSRGVVSVFIATPQSREERVKLLHYLVNYAMLHYGTGMAFGVVTDAGVSGRSYDYMVSRGQLTDEAIEFLKSHESPFTDSNEQL